MNAEIRNGVLTVSEQQAKRGALVRAVTVIWSGPPEHTGMRIAL